MPGLFSTATCEVIYVCLLLVRIFLCIAGCLGTHYTSEDGFAVNKDVLAPAF